MSLNIRQYYVQKRWLRKTDSWTSQPGLNNKLDKVWGRTLGHELLRPTCESHRNMIGDREISLIPTKSGITPVKLAPIAKDNKLLTSIKLPMIQSVQGSMEGLGVNIATE